MINKILRLIFALPLFIIIILILFINVKLYDRSELAVASDDTLNIELIAELQGLKNSLADNADEDMQQLFPEGFLFMNALYGLSWCNFIDGQGLDSKYYHEGMQEIQSAYNKVNSAQGRSSFNADLPLAYGAFYTGWSTYLLARKLSLEQPDTRSADEEKYFKSQCLQISNTIQANPFPVSYSGGAWPADAMICVAALSLHDQIYSPLYTEVIATWIVQVKSKLDHRGLIPHGVNASTGKVEENARGSSQSLMLIFLRDIDESFANEQYKRYDTAFLETRFGLSGVREYPRDEPGVGDVDSGPIVFGMGSAATIVGMGTLYQFNDNLKEDRIERSVEALGFPLEISGRKLYLFGALPMADAFICWAHSLQKSFRTSKPDFIDFHLYSATVFLVLVILLYFFLKSEKPSSERSLHIPW